MFERLRFSAWLGAVLLLALAQPAAAQVTVTFYTHGWGTRGGSMYYPHAFLRVAGGLADGRTVDESYGFTTDQTALVFSKAKGYVTGAEPWYLAESTPHFSLAIDDERYESLMRRIDTWRTPPGSDYNLNTRNCIIFVADLARELGLAVGDTSTLKPVVFMRELLALNPDKVAPPQPVELAPAA